MPLPTSPHIPVLLSEVLTGLKLKPGDDVVDATLGGGGHTRAILESTAPTGRVLAIEADPRTLSESRRTLQDVAGRITFVNTNFSNLKTHATEHRYRAVAGALFDLGLASITLADPSRGFSFQSVGPLDMRLNPEAQTLTAADIVNRWPADELVRIFREFGEERQAKKIAEQLVERRKTRSFDTTDDLVDTVASVKYRRGRIHPATKVFQALRMAVNDEYAVLRATLPQAVSLLRIGGRLAVITFHSGEDRLVKQWAKEAALAGQVTLVNKHVIKPTREEILTNPRSRSAKLRIIEKIKS